MVDAENSGMINNEYLHAAESSLLISQCNVTFASIVEDQVLLNPITDIL